MPGAIGEKRQRNVGGQQGGRGGRLAHRQVGIVHRVAELRRLGLLPLVEVGIDAGQKQPRAGDAIAQVDRAARLHVGEVQTEADEKDQRDGRPNRGQRDRDVGNESTHADDYP